MQNINMGIGISKQFCTYKLRQLSALVCMCLLVSCTSYVTYTDYYCITNETDTTICLVFTHSVMWDSCANENPQRAWFDKNTIQIETGKTARLHPIRKEYTYTKDTHYWDVTPVAGKSVQLIAWEDTILWQTDEKMFESDSIWSFYNTQDWKSEKDSKNPYSSIHTFFITTENIERSKQ